MAVTGAVAVGAVVFIAFALGVLWLMIAVVVSPEARPYLPDSHRLAGV